MTRFRNSIALIGAAAAICVSCGESPGLSPAEANDTVEGIASVNDFMSVRAGDAVRDYLGYEQSPDLRNRIDNAIADAQADCAIAPPPPAVLPDSSVVDMRWEDRASFRTDYGYGVALEAKHVSDAAKEPVGTEADPDVREVDWPAIAECEERISKAIDQLLAPVEVNLLFGELVMEAANSKTFEAPTKAWQACMARAGFPTSESPLTSQVIVENRLIEVYEDALRATSDNENAEVDFHSEERIALEDQVLNELQEFEQSVFHADAQCLVASGAGEAMLEAEQGILDQLQKTFTYFKGVDQTG